MKIFYAPFERNPLQIYVPMLKFTPMEFFMVLNYSFFTDFTVFCSVKSVNLCSVNLFTINFCLKVIFLLYWQEYSTIILAELEFFFSPLNSYCTVKYHRFYNKRFLYLFSIVRPVIKELQRTREKFTFLYKLLSQQI